jgi:hypothetical protein
MRHMLRSRRSRFLVAGCLFFVLLKCDAGRREQPAREIGSIPQTRAVKTRYVERQTRVGSSSAPGGSWVVSLRYPQIDSGVPAEVRRNINSAIEATTKEYACKTPGDQQFKAEITKIDAKLMSMKYEAMWMCSSMPSPGSKIGGLTYDLGSGHKIDLDNELNDTGGGELDRLISKQTRAAIRKKLGSDASYCPEPQSAHEFFLEDRTIVFVGMFPSHADAACEVEVSMPLAQVESYLRKGSVLVERRSTSGAS